MATQTFHLFPELPEELRRDIWELTFLPRLISLKCGIEQINETSPPPFVYQVAPQPYELADGKKSKSFPLYNPRKAGLRADFTSAYLTVDEKYATPSALSTHRESRKWAKSDGYVAWTMRSRTRSRDIIWNPRKDIVDFFENHNSSLGAKGLLMKPVILLSMLSRQFPSETTEVRYLSLPSRYWETCAHMSNTVAWPLINYVNLRELMVVVDREFELARIEEIKARNPSQWRVWMLPEDLKQNLQDIRDHYERWWPERAPHPKPASVRIVMNVNGIFSGEDRHLTLRCSPCYAFNG